MIESYKMKDNLRLQSEKKPDFQVYKYHQKLSNPVKISFLKKSSSQEKNVSYIIPEFLRNNSILNDKCGLCSQFFKKSQMEGLSDCQHTFCPACLHKYCIYKIDVMEDVTCPQEGCRAMLQQTQNVFAGLPLKTKDKFKKNVLWKQTVSNPFLKLCPSENCRGIINKSADVYQCNQCLKKYCKECELIQHAGPCDQNFQNTFIGWKRCPQCKMFIERTKGCNHMVCRCGYSFCFICLSRWSQPHYDCNPGNPRFQLDQIGQLACWQKFIIGILIIICLPIFLAVYVALWSISIVLTTFCGFLGGPVFCYTNFVRFQFIQCFLFWPICMVLGAIVGAIAAICLGCYIFGMGVKRIVYTLGTLWCCERCQIYPDLEEPFQDIGL